MESTPLVIVETEEALRAAIQMMRGEPVLGVDTEADSMHHYREKVCLLQLSDRHRDYIIDPLAGFSLEPLAELMAAKDVIKVFHGADYDVVSLKRDFGFQIRGIFDTMIAAQLIDRPRVGLADIVRGLFGFDMDKKYQTCDWSRRPLTSEQLDYARGDTHFLLAIREHFERKLTRFDRLSIAEEEFALVEAREWTTRPDVERAFLRVKRASKLEAHEKKVLRCLWEMRDAHARKLDRPPYKVIPGHVLIMLAQVAPRSREALGEVIRLKSSMSRRFGDSMLSAIEQGRSDERPLPQVARRIQVGTPPRHGSRETERLVGKLKAWRSAVMDRDGVPLVMVLSNSQIKAIAGYRPVDQEEFQGMEELRDWQVARYGTELLSLVADFGEDLQAQPKRKRKRTRKRSTPKEA